MRSLRDKPEPLSITKPSKGMPCCVNQRRTDASAQSRVLRSGAAAAPAVPCARFCSSSPVSRYSTRVATLSEVLFKGRSHSPQGRASRRAIRRVAWPAGGWALAAASGTPLSAVLV